MNIRYFNPTDEEYAAVVAIQALNFPVTPGTVADWKHGDATRDPKYPFQREVVEIDGNIVAVGDYGQNSFSFHPQKYNFWVAVHPDYHAAGIREAYLAHVIDTLADKDLIAIVTSAAEYQTSQIAFLEANGFKLTMRYPRSRLDLATFDWDKFAGKDQVAGITIRRLSDLQPDVPDWQRRMWELETTLMTDVPLPNPYVPPDMATWLERNITRPDFDPAAWVYALDGDAWVGQTTLIMSPATPDKFYTMLTGVRREYRRRGIAVALKLYAIRHAIAAGAAAIETNNEEKNPMYHINILLGFEPIPAWVDFEKVLR